MAETSHRIPTQQPWTAGDHRLQPDTPSEQFAFTATRHDVEPNASGLGPHG